MAITNSNLLLHTNHIFESFSPDNIQQAAIDLSDRISNAPIERKILKEEISDLYKLAEKQNKVLFDGVENYGLVDYEDLDNGNVIYYNGNIFRGGEIDKVDKVLSSLKQHEQKLVLQFNEYLHDNGCCTEDEAVNILGTALLNKLLSIALYDKSTVRNLTNEKNFLTQPSAFSKFGNPFADDVLNNAKAFIASLFYGMSFSPSNRGRIVSREMLINTLKKLLRGEEVGPCTAIGQDYYILEERRVLETIPDEKKPGRFSMRLLKYDVGELALNIFQKGDIAEETTVGPYLKSSSANGYISPEYNRGVAKKVMLDGGRKRELVETLRTLE